MYMHIYFRYKIKDWNPIYIYMALTEFIQYTQDQIFDLLDNLQQIEKLKNTGVLILLNKKAIKYGGKVVNKWNPY